jgi:hypothetical protein
MRAATPSGRSMRRSPQRSSGPSTFAAREIETVAKLAQLDIRGDQTACVCKANAALDQHARPSTVRRATAPNEQPCVSEERAGLRCHGLLAIVVGERALEVRGRIVPCSERAEKAGAHGLDGHPDVHSKTTRRPAAPGAGPTTRYPSDFAWHSSVAARFDKRPYVEVGP